MGYIELLQQNLWLYYTVVFVLGLLVGSFLNVVIYRLPIMLKRQWRSDCLHYLAETNDPALNRDYQADTAADFNLTVPRSRCPHCDHLIRAWENIPLLSYLLLRGKCHACGARISLRYPLIELLSAVLVTLVAWRFGVNEQAALAMLLTWALLALTFIDLDHQYLPDNITLPFLWLGLLIALYGVFTEISASVWGAAAGYTVLWSIYIIFKKLTGKEGMGFGDFKLLAMLGAWLGWQKLPAIILMSSLVGALVGIALILLRRHQRGVPIPFGPYLAAAGWLVLLWGDDINHAYLQWVGLR
ncbi:MAG: A24 family peptidase [Gammaproteobacteria bacterium]